MKLISQIIQYNLSRYNDYMIKRRYIRGIYKFYCSYMLSVSFLRIYEDFKLPEKDIKIRNILYQQIFGRKEISKKQFEIINNLISSDMKIVIRAIETLDKIQGEKSSYVSETNRDDFVAILGSELENLL